MDNVNISIIYFHRILKDQTSSGFQLLGKYFLGICPHQSGSTRKHGLTELGTVTFPELLWLKLLRQPVSPPSTWGVRLVWPPHTPVPSLSVVAYFTMISWLASWSPTTFPMLCSDRASWRSVLVLGQLT
ncbi:hypothetical protein CI610_03492 [invertebrate metagenome]|uniref:Uncharacterized protein n=1 Tax=invertebrate metagenome TaxID=1711999 RepID=A0A2H9T305_9ZZZZ